MGNVDTHRTAHDAFNRRDLDATVSAVREDAEIIDHPRGMTIRGGEGFAAYLGQWVESFPDIMLTERRYLDAGDASVALYTGTGTNHGALGPLPPTGKRMAVPFCEIAHFDGDGRITGVEFFYDVATIMSQLGHMALVPA